MGSKSTGQIAFEAYSRARGGKNHDGTPMPVWGELGEGVRGGWEVAGTAVAIDTLHKLQAKQAEDAKIPGMSRDVTITPGPPALPPRPTFTSLEVTKPVLLTSLEHAIETLGEGEGGLISGAFISDEGTRGVWAVPHPESRDTEYAVRALVPEVRVRKLALAIWDDIVDRRGMTDGVDPQVRDEEILPKWCELIARVSITTKDDSK